MNSRPSSSPRTSVAIGAGSAARSSIQATSWPSPSTSEMPCSGDWIGNARTGETAGWTTPSAVVRLSLPKLSRSSVKVVVAMSVVLVAVVQIGVDVARLRLVQAEIRALFRHQRVVAAFLDHHAAIEHD